MKRTRYNSIFRFFLTLVAVSFLLLLGCGGNGSSTKSGSGTGALTFNLSYHGDGDRFKTKTDTVDCADLNVEIIEAVVYDQNEAILVDGGPWDCREGLWTIPSVPVGKNLSVVVLAKNDEENIILSGRKTDLQVYANAESNAGIIDCFAFIPSQQAPNNGEGVNIGDIDLEWSDVIGAADYRIVVSVNSDLSDPVIDVHTELINYSIEGLPTGKTYYWQVYALDSDGNSGVGSSVWSFTSSGSSTGVLTFNVIFHAEGDRSQTETDIVDCADLNIVTIEAMVYDDNYALLANVGPWGCDTGPWTIPSVPAGENFFAVVLAKNNDGGTVMRGQKEGLTVIPDTETNVKNIDCFTFIPIQQAPNNGERVNIGAIDLEWSDVIGAAEYRVVISENSDLSDPVINVHTEVNHYSPKGLQPGKTYYWMAFAIDSNRNTGVGSSIRSFTIRPS